MFNGIDLIVIRSCLVKEKTELNEQLTKLSKIPRVYRDSQKYLDTIQQLAIVEEVIQKVDKQLEHKAGDD
jgi:hypothetical protein